ncbi:hypothetical protein V1520DRAFT_4980 [Lipomyces starkeyi]|uniref:Uncharacterized protein n=1 Tax=Lipomyces starkeyi NRRL Y-11557 TaxID=675824 RepID=A0A1E3Q971_LIPST|nr:hypothetical protein LIPSTDRAFT_2248 [Lipomyces starkeyi NRRL Y-11557]
MTSKDSEPETSEAKDFSDELDQIFGLGQSKTVFSARSSSIINHQQQELSIIEQQIRATDERLRRRHQEFEQGMTGPITNNMLGKKEGSINAPSASTSVLKRVPRKSLETSRISALSDASDTLYNPRSRPSSNGHTIALTEGGSRKSRDQSLGDQSRQTSIGAIGAKLQSWTKHHKQEKSQGASRSASDCSTVSGNGRTTNEGTRSASHSTGDALKSPSSNFQQRNVSSQGFDDSNDAVVNIEKSTLDSSIDSRSVVVPRTGSATAVGEGAAVGPMNSSYTYDWDDAADSISTDKAKNEVSVKDGFRKTSGSGKSFPSWMKLNKDSSGSSKKSAE